MLAWYCRHYVSALYVTLGILFAFNALALAQGNWQALLPMSIEAAIAWSVLRRKPWAYLVIRVWAIISIVSGTSLWLAVLLRGGTIVESAYRVVVSTVLLLVGLFFIWRAKTALSIRHVAWEGAAQANVASQSPLPQADDQP